MMHKAQLFHSLLPHAMIRTEDCCSPICTSSLLTQQRAQFGNQRKKEEGRRKSASPQNPRPKYIPEKRD